MRFIGQLFFASAFALLGAAAQAANPAGNAVAVIQQAKGELDGSTTVIAVGDGLFMGQQVITGTRGQVQIVFSDSTHLVVGPGSSLVISEYLMRNNGTASKFVVDALSGTFRFVTGKSRHDAYEIRTPTGTLGVRGTAFDFSIEPRSGETAVLLYHGGVEMCAAAGDCVMLTEVCDLGLIPRRNSPTILTERKRPPKLKGFPYLSSQRPLRDDFRIRAAADCKQAPAAAHISTPP
ncbi:MAG: hypothetical protein EOP22_17855 [Hyphomicrobiales bacterium]|nr:MAG: hypothetical protein EOP22_17855 [Hyphomicrobiales bacterium]